MHQSAHGKSDYVVMQLANVLACMGTGVDVPVGILMERCPELYIAMLAVLKVRLSKKIGSRLRVMAMCKSSAGLA